MRVIDTHDREWSTEDHQLISQNETGRTTAGHYLWVNGTTVSSNALCTNQKSKYDLNIFTIKTTEIVVASGIFLRKQKAQLTGNKIINTLE